MDKRCGRSVIEFAMALMLAAFGASQAGASVIYDGGAPNFYTYYFADTSASPAYTTVAESFVLQPGATIVTDAHWWGTCASELQHNPCPTGNFVIGFYTDGGGTPGTLISQYSVNGNQTATGNFVGTVYPEYAYSASFVQLALTAGTNYFFTVSNTTNNNAWGMETTGSIGAGSAKQLTGSGWTTIDDNLAFNLTGEAPVPEPATLGLFALGLFGLGWSRLKKA